MKDDKTNIRLFKKLKVADISRKSNYHHKDILKNIPDVETNIFSLFWHKMILGGKQQ